MRGLKLRKERRLGDNKCINFGVRVNDKIKLSLGN
jgi:hypothetical protein